MASLRPFLAGIIDYAGLFPPAKLDMSAAARAYAEQLDGPDRDLLGRFVVPAERLAELSSAISPLVERDKDPWKVSAIVTGDVDSARAQIERFNSAHVSVAACDTVEARISSHDEIARCVQCFGESFSIFLEVAPADPAILLREIASTPASAKLRTGGVTPEAIPEPNQVWRFMEICVDEGIPFKATAGLHHAIRGRYPLTYEPDSPVATMHGYLNIFLAAGYCAAGSSPGAVLGVIEETDAAAFRFDDRGVWWKDHLVVHDELGVVRETVATSFGSCSFSEPVSEARRLRLI